MENSLDPPQIKLCLNAGRNIFGGSSQVIFSAAEGRRQNEAERSVAGRRRIVSFQRFDAEGTGLCNTISPSSPSV